MSTISTSSLLSGHPELAINGGNRTVTLQTTDRWPRVHQKEIDMVVELMKRGEISIGSGGVISEFETKFANYIGAKYCLALNNGTNGLFSAYFAANVRPGDEVIVPSYTWHATVTTIIHSGGIPVFCEISPQTLCADPSDIERKITPRTRAIVITQMWGNMPDMDRLTDISRRHNIPMIEDSSHAHGAEWKDKKIGTIGDIGVFSLQGSKPLAGGEAGVVVTDNPEYYDRMLVLGHHGRRFAQELVTDKYVHLAPQGVGLKFRAHPLAVAIAMCQLERLDEVNRRRAETWTKYDAGLGGLPGIELIAPLPGAKRAGFYEYRMLYKPEELGGLPRAEFIQALQAEGVPTDQDRYQLNHLHPFFSRNWGGVEMGFMECGEASATRQWGAGDLPVTESVYERLLSLPSYTDPEPGLIDQIIQAFDKVTRSLAR